MQAELPDFDSLVVELGQLERREREVSDYRRRLHARLDTFPNELTVRKEQEVSAERRELHRRMTELRAVLRSMVREQEPKATRRLGP